MVNLDTLPPPVLLLLVRCFEAKEDEYDSTRDFEPCEKNVVPRTDELVALASCNKALRHQLVPLLFRSISVSEPEEPADYINELAKLAESSQAMLASVRVLTVDLVGLESIKHLSACLRHMTSLQRFHWFGYVPLAPLLVDTLKALPDFHALVFGRWGTESLPYVLPLAAKVDHLRIDAEILPPYPHEALALAPLTVGAERRSRLAWDHKNVATVHEQRDALVKGLSAFLLEAKGHLEYLNIQAADLSIEATVPGTRVSPVFFSNNERIVTESGKWLQRLFDAMVDDNRQYPRFPMLKRLCINGGDIKCLAFKHLLQTTADHLTHLEIVGADHKELPEPPRPFPKLEYFFYLFDDDLSCVPITRHITTHSPLRMLTLNGMRPSELGAIFGPDSACSATLTRLQLIGFAGGGLQVEHAKAMALKFPEIEELRLESVWHGEAVDFLKALDPLKKLRKFTFDHPWERPRTMRWPGSDGRTIRRERDGDFTVVSVMGGKTIDQEIHDRILADMNAVKPTYAKHFASFAHKHPQLEQINWGCSDKTCWRWSFSRKDDPSSPCGYKLIYKQVPDIGYGKGDPRPDEVVSGGVYYRPRES